MKLPMGILQRRVVGERHMEAGHTGPLQRRYHHRKLLDQHPGIAVVRVFLPDGQLEVNGHIRQKLPDRRYRLHGKVDAVLNGPAIFVGAVVEHGGSKAAAHPVAVNLDHVESRLAGLDGRGTEAGGHLPDLLRGKPADVGADLLVEQGTEVLHADLFGQHARHIFEHRLHVGVALVKLGAGQAVFPMNRVREFAVGGKPLRAYRLWPKPNRPTGTSPRITMAHPPAAI